MVFPKRTAGSYQADVGLPKQAITVYKQAPKLGLIKGEGGTRVFSRRGVARARGGVRAERKHVVSLEEDVVPRPVQGQPGP